MSDIKSKPIRKDSAVADLGDPIAAALAALKPGESIDIVQRTEPTITTPVARDLGPRPEKFFDEGIGAGRTPPGIAQYVSKLESEPAGTPGFGRTAPSPMATTYRGDSFASGLDGRVNGSDEGGTMTFGSETKPAPTNPSRLPDPDASGDSGGPIKKGARRSD
jgi:hypothetical protein